MEALYNAFADGRLTHNNPEHVLEQLRAEGTKRLHAFVFEVILRYRLNQIAVNTPGLIISFGWHIGYNKLGEPSYWFRLMSDAADWNECDETMLARLAPFRTGGQGNPVTVLRVKYDQQDNVLCASPYRGDKWQPWLLLDTALDRLPLRRRSRQPKSMDFTSPGEADAAFRWLNNPRLRAELHGLSVQRRFMNLSLSPRLGREGTDLDAVLLTAGGQLCTLEFKRKYPAQRAQAFGLDEYPHVRTIRTMDSLNIRNLHLILVSPLWEKNQSPLTWLSDRGLDPHWTWLAATLNGETLGKEGSRMHTSGKDSGQRNTERQQRPIEWDSIFLLNKGLSLKGSVSAILAQFLTQGTIDGAVTMTYRELAARRLRHRPATPERTGDPT